MEPLRYPVPVRIVPQQEAATATNSGDGQICVQQETGAGGGGISPRTSELSSGMGACGCSFPRENSMSNPNIGIGEDNSYICGRPG
ncbi:hypothetical protein TRIUR3_31097 [Triticum urartu]|uniref:Uncharacterized protein n=1 Tax=Triticum urartu TaxID=4572 RepID=M7ZLG0_TRIUA|nr:hypothetical protein TRIUR3_31097 [Triticum urartu]